MGTIVGDVEGDSVGDMVGDNEGERVGEMLGEMVGESVVSVVVGLVVVVNVVVPDVVGVVTSQFWKPPCWNASIISFKLSATAPHFVVVTESTLPTQPTFMFWLRGPRNSLTAVLIAAAS